MRKSAAVLASALFVTACSSAFAKTETVTGRVIDLVCYSGDRENTGNHHKGRGLICAQACARGEGQPVGLLTADGKVYQVTGGLAADNNAKLVPHMSQTVTVTGDVSEKDGLMMIAASDLKMNN